MNHMVQCQNKPMLHTSITSTAWSVTGKQVCGPIFMWPLFCPEFDESSSRQSSPSSFLWQWEEVGADLWPGLGFCLFVFSFVSLIVDYIYKNPSMVFSGDVGEVSGEESSTYIHPETQRVPGPTGHTKGNCPTVQAFDRPPSHSTVPNHCPTVSL